MNVNYVFLTIFLIISLPASAKTVNLANRNEVDGTFEVGFCARPTPDSKANLPGHMFVVFSHFKNNGERTFTAIGHTVAADVPAYSAVWSYFGMPVSGLLKRELYSHVQEKCLVAKVNKDTYLRALDYTTPPLVDLGLGHSTDTVFQHYKLGENDCITFATKIAMQLKQIGLTVPERGETETPMDYMVRMINSN